MKRSEINQAYRDALAFFNEHHWCLPPSPRWDITDFGLGQFRKCGLTLVNLAEEAEYCEKIMFAYDGQVTLAHTHRIKKEDIICRQGRLRLSLGKGPGRFEVKINGQRCLFEGVQEVVLTPGERITLTPGVFHAFWPEGGPALIGEVSTANDDVHDNIFAEPTVGRFSEIVEDEPAAITLLHE